MSSLSQNVLTLLVKYFFWSLLCSKYKYTHTHAHTGTHVYNIREAVFILHITISIFQSSNSRCFHSRLISVAVCVCVCARVCVCVCVCVFSYGQSSESLRAGPIRTRKTKRGYNQISGKSERQSSE